MEGTAIGGRGNMSMNYGMTTLIGELGTLDFESVYVALLDKKTIQKHRQNRRSVLGRIAWRVSNKQPCGPWFLDGKAALISTLPLEKQEVHFRVGADERSVIINPVDIPHTPNLWDLVDRIALSSILSSQLRKSIEELKGVDFRFDRGSGVLTITDYTELHKNCPNWYGWSSPKELEALWTVKDVPQLKKTEIPVLKPYRFISFSPGVGLQGQPLLKFGFSTRMETHPKFTLSKIINMRRDWTNIYNKSRFLFRISVPIGGDEFRIIPDSGTWFIDSIDARTMQNALNEGRPAILDLEGWLQELGIPLPDNERERISDERAVHIIRNVFDNNPEKICVPARYLAPVIDFGNTWFYNNFTKENLDIAYAHLTQLDTRVKVAMLETIGNYLSKNLRGEINCKDGARDIRFNYRRWDEKEVMPPTREIFSPEERRIRLTGNATLFELRDPPALLRRKGIFVPVSLSRFQLGEDEEIPSELADKTGLNGYWRHGDFQIYRSAPQLANRIKLAIIAPAQKTSGDRPIVADLLPATFNKDVDAILPKKKRLKVTNKRVHPLKYLDVQLDRLFNFFETSPMDTFFEPVIGDRSDSNAYKDAMDRANSKGAQAFIIILPKGVQKRKADEIYFNTMHYGFLENKPVIHFYEGKWKKDTTFYSMVFVTLAKLNTRFGGLTFKIDLAKTVPLFKKYKNPLIVAYDFGRSTKSYLGVVTATDTATQEMIARKTPEISGIKEAIDELEKMLGGIIKSYEPDILVVLRDSKFASAELRGMRIQYDRFEIPTLPIETVKSGGVSGYCLTPRGRGNKINVSSPYGHAYYTPEMDVNVFSSQMTIRHGVWNAIRYAINPRPYPIDLDFDYEDVANLGFGLSMMAGYYADPSKSKYPDILGRADKLIDLYQGGALSGINRDIGAREFDPTN